MASLLEDGCKICFNGYNGSDRHSVALPCSHSFCITCITQMRSNDNHTCPVCRADWAHLQLTVDVKPKEIETDHDKDNKNMPKEDEANALCPDHSLLYLFWCNDCKEFFCKRCATNKHRTCSYDVIEDCSLNVEQYIKDEIANTILKIQGNSNVLHAAYIQASEKLSSVTKLLEALTKHQHNLTDHIKQLEDMISSRSQDMESVKQYGSKVEMFTRGPDISGILKCMKMFNEFSLQKILPAPDIGMTQLNKFANTFVKETQEDTEVAAALRGALWNVTAINWRSAVVALAEVQPSLLDLISNEGLTEALSLNAVAAVAGAVKTCHVRTQFLDSFYNPVDPSIDRQRLEILSASPSLHLDVFFGHLDAAGIARLPETVTELYLAISNASEAAAISNMTVWDNLREIGVTVASSVAPEHLQPLPEVEYKSLYFCGTTDSQINMVASAILALLPKRRCSLIYLLDSKLTAQGLLLLSEQFRHVAVDALCIKPGGAWRPGKEEQKSISDKISRAVNVRCNVTWK